MRAAGGRREVVLVGGGHSHVQLLRHFIMEPLPGARVTVVVDTPVAMYSGMVPGYVAGGYRREELEIDVLPLARRAGARIILAPATAIDADRRRIEIAGRPPVPYDVASLDIGSTVAGLDLPGIREHALPTRPISRLVDRVGEIIERGRAARGDGPFRVTVVGGGVGGVELAFCLDHRLRETGVEPAITLLNNKERLLRGQPSSLVARAERCLRARGITARNDVEVVSAAADRVHLAGGETLPTDALVWVTGAVSHDVLAASGLPTEPRGFVKIRSTLQVEGHDDLFAVGDCATLSEYPRTPKAGVYAVREGPYLIENLQRFLAGRELRRYVPQHDFLALLNMGDGTALGAKWGRSFEGAWVMRLKDWIDRRFMVRFQALEPDGRRTEIFRAVDRDTAEKMGDREMLCGGCAAKVGQSTLERALARLGPGAADPTVESGLEAADDAAIYRLPGGDRLAVSLDAFRAFTDDPWLVGRAAAVNALSDLDAKGVAPRWAQALVTVPEAESAEQQEETLYQVLAGARAAFDPRGVTLVGGHSTTGPELVVGFQIDGVVDGEPLPLDGLAEGDVLVLTKPLGTGVLFRADGRGLVRGPWLLAACDSLLADNGAAGSAARHAGATAATDVTGFGLAGHLSGMLRRAGLAAEIDLGALPALPGALELLARGERSTFHAENRAQRRAMAIDPSLAGDPRLELLFDPQTAGGLLIGIPSARAEELLGELRESGSPHAAIVGRTTAPRKDGALIAVAAG